MPSVSNSPLLPDGTPRISLQPAPSKPFQYEGSVAGLEPIEDYDTETVQMDDGDSCCSDAKDKLARAWAESNNMSPANAQHLRTKLDEMPCDQFRQMLEQEPGTGPATNMERHFEVLARDRQILDEWDECASKNFSGDFTASADPFEAAWDIMQKQIGRDDFGYNLAIQPQLMASNFGNLPAELGLRLSGNIPIKEALRHLEASQDLESYARTKGFETAEDVGLREEDFDDIDEFYEAMAEYGVGQDPLDYLEYGGEYQYFRPSEAQDLAISPRTGNLSDAEILRVNMESMGHPSISREAFPPIARDRMIDALEQRIDAGATRAPVAAGNISALGQGPMIDVNPAFAGMGLGVSTLAGLLENTGRVMDTNFSPAGLATIQSLARQLDEAGIEHNFYMSPSVKRPLMDAEQQIRNWQQSQARYPHRGEVKLSIGDGTQLTSQGTPDNVGVIQHSINQQLDNEPPSTMEEMREMLDRSKRRRRGLTFDQPPTFASDSLQRPFSAPSFQDRIDWGE